MRSMRRSSSAAVNRMIASFANSEGWTPSGPTCSHRLAPFTSAAKSTPMSATTATTSPVQMTIGCRYDR